MNKCISRWSTVAMVTLLTACKDPQPERPTEPPTPTAVVHEEQARPAFAARIDAGSEPTTYEAYFNHDQVARIREQQPENAGFAEYEYQGARLLKYVSQSAGNTLLQLDSTGRIQHASHNAQPLAPQEIEQIRTRAELLRSHALAQRASRMHAVH